jgi:hypothetical protein
LYRACGRRSLRSHVCGPRRVFSDVHAAEKNGFDFFRGCGREFCETALAFAFCTALWGGENAGAFFASKKFPFPLQNRCRNQVGAGADFLRRFFVDATSILLETGGAWRKSALRKSPPSVIIGIYHSGFSFSL